MLPFMGIQLLALVLLYAFPTRCTDADAWLPCVDWLTIVRPAAGRSDVPAVRSLKPSIAMKTTSYPTPQDAEAAFYEALEAGDLEAMMEVWAEDEEIVCVHPGGPRLSGYDAVRESWAGIFASGQKLKVLLSDPVYLQGMMLSVHSVHENITVEGQGEVQHPVVTTNVFIRTAGGWRMIVHHASPAPAAARAAREEPPKILH